MPQALTPPGAPWWPDRPDSPKSATYTAARRWGFTAGAGWGAVEVGSRSGVMFVVPGRSFLLSGQHTP